MRIGAAPKHVGRVSRISIAGATIAAMALAGSSAASSTTSALGARKVVTLGFIVPQTGAAAPQGLSITNGALLAAAILSASKNGPVVKLSIQDSQTTPAVAVSAFNTLFNAKGLKAIVGPGSSGEGLAIAPLASSNHVVVMAPGVSSPAFTSNGGYAFRTWAVGAQMVAAVAAYLNKIHGYKAVGVLAEDSSTSHADAAAVQAMMAAGGGQLTDQEFVDPAQSNYLPQLSKVIATKPDILMIEFTSPASIGNAVKQARQLGWAGPILSGNNVTNAAFVNAAGATSDGTIFAIPAPPTASSAYKSFVKAFIKKYGSPPDVLAASAYDDVQLLARAVAAVGNNGPKVRAWLMKLKNFPGVSGPITFQNDGNLKRKPLAIETFSFDGRIVVVGHA